MHSSIQPELGYTIDSIYEDSSTLSSFGETVIKLYKSDNLFLNDKKLVGKRVIWSMLTHTDYLNNILCDIGEIKSITLVLKTLASAYAIGYLNPGCIVPDASAFPIKDNYSHDFIQQYRDIIHGELVLRNMGSLNLIEVTKDDLEFTSDLYFKYFITNIQNAVEYEIANRCYVSAGKTKTKYGRNTTSTKISISNKVISISNASVETPLTVNGITCTDSIYVFLLVLEHELCHFIVDSTRLRLLGTKVYTEHGEFFKQVARSFFGHTATMHQLFHNENQCYEIGEVVSFIYPETKEVIHGKIIKLLKNKIRITPENGDGDVTYTVSQSDVIKVNIE